MYNIFHTNLIEDITSTPSILYLFKGESPRDSNPQGIPKILILSASGTGNCAMLKTVFCADKKRKS